MSSLDRIRHSLPVAGGILAASMLLGIAYNSASPLGVRSTPAPDDVAPDNRAEAAARSPAPAATERTAAAASTSTAHATSAPASYQNQTLSISLQPAVSATAGPGLPSRPTRTSAAPSILPPTTAMTGAVAQAQAAAAAITSLAWPQVKETMAQGNTVLVDARAAAQYQAEHIPGAESLPAGTAPAEIAAFVAKHGTNKTYIVYCGSGQCGLSKTVAESLRRVGGATDVKTFPGGYAEYRVSEQRPATP